ncbi:SDR family NAD(P)-dependent oxidoreductase [Streptomyces globisporus]|uniref:SDR family NAD(P)-dependent oxidoreductase n=1 Tax=Streptomyces globisporus TaxID=1908 RepID=UPI003811C875
MGTIVIIGGTSGVGRALAVRLAQQGESVVITGRDRSDAEGVAAEISAGVSDVRGLSVDLSRPHGIREALSDITHVDHLVVTAVERDLGGVRDYAIARAVNLATIKTVGYVATVSALQDRMAKDASVVFFGGISKDFPFPGSINISTVNSALSGMVAAIARELAPIRVNSVHPGIIGDSPFWSGRQEMIQSDRARTLTGRLATTDDVVDAVVFLMRNRSANKVALSVDGGFV